VTIGGRNGIASAQRALSRCIAECRSVPTFACARTWVGPTRAWVSSESSALNFSLCDGRRENHQR
jgi:hypothetical protein